MIRHQDQNDIKTYNMKLILDVVRQNKPISRAALAKTIKISPPSVTRIISQMQKIGVINETHKLVNGVGRSAVLLDLVPNSVYTVGVQIDSQFLKVCIADFCYEIVVQDEIVFHDFSFTAAEVAALAYDKYKELAERAGICSERVAAVGIAIVGTVDPIKGNVLLSPQTGWENEPLGDIFIKAFGLPVYIENDVKASLVGEKHYSKMNISGNIAVLNIGSGMGAAASSDGIMIRGKQNAAGEIGHIIIDPSNRIRCDCGRVGCLQTYAAEDFIVQRARQFSPDINGFHDLRTAFDSGAQWAIEIVDDIYNCIQIALNILMNMYNPSTIVAWGTFFDYFGEFVSNIEERLNRLAFKSLGSTCSLVLSKTNGNGCVLGASIIASEGIMYENFCSVSTTD